MFLFILFFCMRANWEKVKLWSLGKQFFLPKSQKPHWCCWIPFVIITDICHAWGPSGPGAVLSALCARGHLVHLSWQAWLSPFYRWEGRGSGRLTDCPASFNCQNLDTGHSIPTPSYCAACFQLISNVKTPSRACVLWFCDFVGPSSELTPSVALERS